MGYLEAPLSLNPSDREPKTTIVTKAISCLLADRSLWNQGVKPFVDCSYLVDCLALSVNRGECSAVRTSLLRKSDTLRSPMKSCPFIACVQ